MNNPYFAYEEELFMSMTAFPPQEQNYAWATPAAPRARPSVPNLSPDSTTSGTLPPPTPDFARKEAVRMVDEECVQDDEEDEDAARRIQAARLRRAHRGEANRAVLAALGFEDPAPRAAPKPASTAPSAPAAAAAAATTAPPPRRSLREKTSTRIKFSDEDLSARSVALKQRENLLRGFSALGTPGEGRVEVFVDAEATTRLEGAVERGSCVYLKWDARAEIKARTARRRLREQQRLMMLEESASDSGGSEGEEEEAEAEPPSKRARRSDSTSTSATANTLPLAPLASEDRPFLLTHQADFVAQLSTSAGESSNHLYDVTSNVDKEEEAAARPSARLAHGWTNTTKLWIPDYAAPGLYVLDLLASKADVACSVNIQLGASTSSLDVDLVTVGVFCLCGMTVADEGYTGAWVCCTRCAAWQHWKCYERQKSKPSSRASSSATTTVSSAPATTTQSTTTAPPANFIPTASAGLLLKCNTSVTSASLKDRRAATLAFATGVSHEALVVPETLPARESDEFLCWTCQTIPTVDKHNKIACDRLDLLLGMISTVSQGYFRAKPKPEEVVRASSPDAAAAPLATPLPPSPPVICRTPDHVMRFVRSLLAQDPAFRGYERFVDLGAGTGALSAALPPGSVCVEIDAERVIEGSRVLPNHTWFNADATSRSFFRNRIGTFDLVLSNPDFEVAVQFIQIALYLIKNHQLRAPRSEAEQEGKLLFLLPSDFFEASSVRTRLYKLLDFRILTEYKLGHLSYYGPKGQKLTCDSLFVLAPGRRDKYEHRVVNAKLAGMLT